MNIFKYIEQKNTMNSITYTVTHRKGRPILFGLLFTFFFLTGFKNGMNFKGIDDLWVVDAGEDQSICEWESIQLLATGAKSYSWTSAAGLSFTSCPDPVASPDFTTRSSVMGDGPGDLTYSPVNCEDVFPIEEVSVNFIQNPTDYCVPIPFSSLSDYELSFQGQPVTTAYNCNIAQTVAYAYGFLPGGGFAGPYTLTSWVVDGISYSGTFNDPATLVSLMNDIDPAGFWLINALGNIVFGGDPDKTYGNLEVTDGNGTPTILMPNFSFQAQGFTVSLTNSGPHLLIALDPDTGCADTLIINGGFTVPPPEEVHLTTVVNTPTTPYCLDGEDLPNGFIVNIGYCGDPENGAVPLASDSCVVYIPNFGFAGQDTFCMVVCDGGFPQICDSTIFYVNVLPETDTVLLTLPAGVSSIDTCLSNLVIELPGGVELAEFCDIDTGEITGTVDGNCVSFSPVNNFSGTTEACVEFCSGGVCDQTIFIISVAAPVVCEDLFDQDVDTLLSAVDTGYFCIPVPTGEIVGYEVVLDGSPASDFIPCDFNEVYFYSYVNLPQAGGFQLDSWLVDGVVFSGSFTDFQILVDSMNVWDQTGSWENNASGFTIIGGDPDKTYGEMVITYSGGSSFTISPDLAVLPLGSFIEVTGYGTHILIVADPDDCSDTINLILEQQIVTPETLFYETSLNTSISSICANTSELIGSLQSFNFCGLPSNGSVTITADSCVSYTPNLNYTGSDALCLVVCDDYFPQVCDTVFIGIQVQLPTDTVFVDADNVVPFDVCLDGSVLQLPGMINSADVCGVNASEVSLSFNGNCVNIDLEDTFVGTTTACVVHCTSDVPPICDTTILVITFDGVFPCDPVFDPDEITVVLDNDTGEVCLPVPLTDIFNYELFLDGDAYTGNLGGCDFDSVFTYFYGVVFAQGNQGPYDVEWMFNGLTLSGTVNNMIELVNLMNGWDPAGNWMLDQSILTILSSNDNGDYGMLTLTHFSGSVAELAPNFNGIPLGTLVTFTGQGPHEVTLVEAVTGCADTLSINAITPPDFIQIETLEDTPSDETCVDTSGLPGNFFELTSCGDPVNGTLEIVGNCFIYTPSPGFTGSDEACVTACDDQGNCETTIIQISVVPICSLYDFFSNDTLEISVDNCADIALICTPIELDSISGFGILDNGSPYTSGFQPCNADFAQLSLDTGFHEVIFIHQQTQCADTLLVKISCVEDNGCGFAALSPLELTLTDCDSTAQFCVAIPFTDIQNFLLTDNGSSFSGVVGACSSNDPFTGLALDTGFHVLIFQDTIKGCADTFLVDVNCVPCPDFFPDDLITASISCEDDLGVVCLPMTPGDLENMVVEINGQLISDPFIPCSFDSTFVFVYSDLPSMGLIGPYEVEEWIVNGVSFSGVFDTADELADLMSQWDVNADWEVSTDPFGNVIITGGSPQNNYGTISITQDLTGENVLLDLELRVTATAFGIELPAGISSVTFTDTVSQCSETVNADIVCVTTDIFIDDILTDASDTLCLDLSELSGAVVSVINICEDLGGENASFEVIGECVIYTGIEVGMDTACIVVCDDLGICDTTILVITTIPGPSEDLIAVNDTIVNGQDQVVLIQVLQNDIFNNLFDFFIVEEPLHGDAVFLPSGQVNYVPDENFCDDLVPDSFTYAICDPFVCDTATVFILIECSELEIFNAFSPNEDGINDFFKIRGLQNYPNHKLYVFNRWGNIVLETANYQSDWFGDWNGKDLPDGTYFYLLDLGEGDKPKSGYVQLLR